MRDRRRAALAAMRFIETRARPHLAAGKPLHTKGSDGLPTLFREKYFPPLVHDGRVRFATPSALARPEDERIVEHVWPVKWIFIELTDPGAHDPRSGPRRTEVLGPAADPDHLLAIVDRFLIPCWVSPAEHHVLDTAGPATRWSAPGGDGWARYRAAGIATPRPL